MDRPPPSSSVLSSPANSTIAGEIQTPNPRWSSKSRWFVQPIPPFSRLALADKLPTGDNSDTSSHTSRSVTQQSSSLPATGSVPLPARQGPLPQSHIQSNSKAPPVLAIEHVEIPATVEVESTGPSAAVDQLPTVVLEPLPEALRSMEEVPTVQHTQSSGETAAIVLVSSEKLEPTETELRPDSQDLEKKEISKGSKPLTSAATMANKPASSNTLPSRLGAWAKPIIINSDAAHLPSPALWPSLSEKGNVPRPFKQVAQAKQFSTAKEDDARFPWAARMDPATRNLYRATEPEYLEDGTPKVTIPNHVLSQGIENQKEFILGQFFRCSPPPAGLIFAVLNKIWGTKCKITIRKQSESSYLFHIPDKATRAWVVQRGLWHVDDCLLFVAPWSADASLAIPEIKTIPVWVTLKKIPNILYTIPAISHIASGLGAPMATYKPILDPFHMGEAKILVEVELSKAFPPKVAASDEKGFISMVDVEYAWIPSICSRCGQLGHKVKRCLEPVPETSNVLSSNDSISVPIPSTLSTKTVHAPSLEVVLPKTTVTSPKDTNHENVSSTSASALSVSEETSTIIPTPAELTPTESASTDSPLTENAPLALIPGSPCTHAVAHKEGKKHDICLGTNQFASLASSGIEEDSSDSDVEPESIDLLTPPGKRILRDRPVKPSAKASESTWQVKGRGRGKQGRGGRG